MNEMTEPADVETGAAIEHDLMPGFVMTVRDSRSCEQSGPRNAPHKAYRVVDPTGNEDWICAYDVHPVEPARPLGWTSVQA